MFDSKAMAPVLKTSATERAAQVPIRVVLAGVLSWSLHAAGHDGLILPWLAVSFLTQAIEFAALRPFRRLSPSMLASWRYVAPALGGVALMSAVHAAIATFVWTTGQPAPVTVAVLIFAGGLLTNVGSGIESRPLFLIGAAPYFLALAAMPYLMLGQGEMANLILLSLAVVLFTASVYAVWARAHASWRAEREARAESQARLLQAELAMADRAAMAAIVSHELRTPLSAIVAGAHVIRGAGAGADVDETADLIADASRLMTGMLNDLLDHSKIEARAMTLEARDFDIQALLRDTAKFWSAPAAQKGLTFSAGPGGEPVWLRGDPYRLRQILNNLVSNAIKFTQAGEVALDVSVAPDADGARRLRLTVRDQGPGISPDAMERLFSPFAQASAEVARTYGGTGLGLTVSRDLARLMGGDLTVESVLGQGAAFTLEVTLPAGQAVHGEEDFLSAAPDLAKQLRVLAVDDHEINRRTLALVLQPLDVALWTAVDGAAALDLLAEQAFDVVLMDVNMPGIDGLETTRRLRAADGPNAQVPVIGFSAATEAAQVDACYAAGMTDWLPKPLEPRRLYAALDQAVRPAAADAA